jgi:hypothetical protein
VVEDLGQRLHAAGDGVVLRDDVRQALAQHALDGLDDLRRGLAHRADAHRDLRLLVGLEQREHLRGEVGVQVGDHERHGLRRLVADEGVDLLGRRAAQELEGPALDRHRQAPDDLARALRADRALEHLARELDAALGEVGLGEAGLDHLLPDLRRDVGGNLLELGHVQRQRLDLVLLEVPEDVGRALGAEAHEQHCRLLATGQPRAAPRSSELLGLGRGVCCHATGGSSAPSRGA